MKRLPPRRGQEGLEPPARRVLGASRASVTRQGLVLLAMIVAVMWTIEAINSLDSNHLSADGIHPRDPGRLWGIVTSPLLHASFAHLMANTVPLVFMGAIVALAGAPRLAAVSAIVVLAGGLGTWLIAPPGTDTIGASGLVFGYAGYLLARGFFDRSALELLAGLVVGVVWGAALLSSLAPHPHISWQGHLCGGLAGILAAWALARRDRRPGSGRGAIAAAKL